MEKEPLTTQLINQLEIYGYEKEKNVFQRAQEIDILKTPKPEDQIEEIGSIEKCSMEKEPLAV